jgi:acyl carrier protein
MELNLEFMQSVFAESLELSEDVSSALSLNSMFEEVEGWDSMGHMRIIMEIENRLDVEFDIDEVIGVDTIEKLIQMAKNKL